jgi:hypothetical protein
LCVNCWVGGGAFQESVQLAGQGALAAAADLAFALALGDAAAGGGPGRPMVGLAEHHDGVQGPMQLPMSAPVEAMTDRLAAGRLHRAAPASMAKAASERNRPGWDQLISSWAPLIGPIPGWASKARVHNGEEWRSSASSSVAAAGPLGPVDLDHPRPGRPETGSAPAPSQPVPSSRHRQYHSQVGDRPPAGPAAAVGRVSGRSQSNARVGCMVWSITVSSSPLRVSRSTSSRRWALKASMVRAAS